MPNRLGTLWAFITGRGEPPEWARHPAAAVGILVLCITFALFVRHVWDADPTVEVMGYVAMFILLGLALLRIGGGK
jgi:hypothetical protein